MTQQKQKITIKGPYDVVGLLKKWKNQPQENFLTITLDGAHQVIKIHHITKGLVNRTIVHPRECYCPAIKDYAAAVVFVHNHTSGNVDPSEEDNDTTRRLCLASAILGINVLDHVIITKNKKYYSFREMGKISDEFSYDEEEKFIEELAAERRA